MSIATETNVSAPQPYIARHILLLRDQRVMLDAEEFANLRSQFVTSSFGYDLSIADFFESWHSSLVKFQSAQMVNIQSARTSKSRCNGYLEAFCQLLDIF